MVARCAGVTLGLALVSAVAFAALTAWLFVWPPTDDPHGVDAVVVLSGGHGERLATGRRLVDMGVASVLVHAGTPDTEDAVQLCAGVQSFEVVCVQPVPDNTRAEARAVARLAASRRWRSLAVVTSSPHLTRAGMLFRRCFDGEVEAVAAWPSYSRRSWRGQIVREWAAVLHVVTIGRGC